MHAATAVLGAEEGVLVPHVQAAVEHEHDPLARHGRPEEGRRQRRRLLDGGRVLPRAHGAGKTITIDYGSPNISKHLAYHHIRGTTLGHAIAQSHRALGYKVVGINFLGDWGTTHGMVLAAYARWGAPEPLTVDALNELYVRFRKEPDAEDQGRAYFKKLEDGDPDTVALWQRFRQISWAEYEEVYKILGIDAGM